MNDNVIELEIHVSRNAKKSYLNFPKKLRSLKIIYTSGIGSV
jgi:hypothetical protein